MKKIINTIALLLIAVAVSAQTAREVLDKTAKTLSNKGGITASFSIKNGAAGTISVKGKKFQATTPDGIVWFNGKTQWTYVKQNSEVNVSNPTDAELQAINPYNFVYIYRNGYKAELKDADKTQTQIAEVLGTSQTMYARYERGANELPIHHLITLSRYYGVSTDYLLGLSKER